MSYVKEVEAFCLFGALSVEALRQKIALLPPDLTNPSFLTRGRTPSFLHRACMNETISLDVVEYLLGIYPESVYTTPVFINVKNNRWKTSAYPLHIACANESCDQSILALLMRKNPAALRRLCLVSNGVWMVDYSGSESKGLPLHYYMMRKSKDIDTVRLLVEAYPEALVVSDVLDRGCFGNGEFGITPIHTLLDNPYPDASLNGIVQFFSETNPNSFRLVDGSNRTPLCVACDNRSMKPEIVQALLEHWPESTRQRDDLGELPIHTLSWNMDLDDAASLDILRLLLSADAQSVREREDHGDELPIQWAVQRKSPEFCRILANAYPESLRIDSSGRLPIHQACSSSRVGIIQTLLELFPESIRLRDGDGNLPIHLASACQRAARAEIVRTLLLRDPDQASEKNADQSLPLHLACESLGRRAPRLDTVRLLFDVFPEAISVSDGRGRTPLDLAKKGEEEMVAAEKRYQREEGYRQAKAEAKKVTSFLDTQLDYVLQAQDADAMATPDHNGWLPLHHALYKSASLGAMKLLVRANPAALQAAVRGPGDEGVLPLHMRIAAEYSTAGVVQFLLDLTRDCTSVCDANGNTLLHYACRGGNVSVVTYLLQKCPASVSKINADNKLPIHLIFESSKWSVDDQRGRKRRKKSKTSKKKSVGDNSAGFIEAVWRLLLAHPETVNRW